MEETSKHIESLQSRLKDGIELKDLLKNSTAEFTLDVSGSIQAEFDTPESESLDIDYFPEFSNLINSKNEHLNFSSKTPFCKLKGGMINVTEDGKITKQILRHGTGEVVSSDAIVYVHYSCYLEMQDVSFDSTHQRDKPLRVQLGCGAVYSGFELSLLTMKLNEYSKFLIEPEYAFGHMGCPPRIPPEATLLLEIELLRIVDGHEIDNGDASLEEKNSFHEVSLRAKKFHQLGNQFYAKDDIIAAIDKYRKVENILLSCKMESDEEEDQCRILLFKAYSNLCLCYNHPKLKSPERVCLAAKEAFYFCPKKAEKSAKLHFHLGKAQLALQNFDKSSKYLKKALSLEPNNKDIKDIMALLEEKKRIFYQYEKLPYQKAFQSQKQKDVQPSTEFKKMFEMQLTELINNDINKIQLPAGLTEKEKNFCQSISKERGVTYEEVIIGGKKTISVTK